MLPPHHVTTPVVFMFSCPVRVPVATMSCPSDWTLTVPSGQDLSGIHMDSAPTQPRRHTHQGPTGAQTHSTRLYHIHKLGTPTNCRAVIWVGRHLPIGSSLFSSQMLGALPLPGRISKVCIGAAKMVFTVAGSCKQYLHGTGLSLW